MISAILSLVLAVSPTVIYALPDDRDVALYVGQQMDVYIEADRPIEDRPSPGASS